MVSEGDRHTLPQSPDHAGQGDRRGRRDVSRHPIGTEKTCVFLVREADRHPLMLSPVHDDRGDGREGGRDLYPESGAQQHGCTMDRREEPYRNVVRHPKVTVHISLGIRQIILCHTLISCVELRSLKVCIMKYH